LQELESQLSALQGEAGLIRVCVDAHIVGEGISGWTAFGRQDDEGRDCDDPAAAEIAGQSRDWSTLCAGIISQRIETSRASLDDPNKPVGVFMLVGSKRRWQTGNGAGVIRPALRAAKHKSHHHQHVGVPGVAYWRSSSPQNKARRRTASVSTPPSP